MLEGLMQHDHPLTLQHVLERMRGMNGDAEVVTLTEQGKTRATYAEVGERVDRLCRGLQELGVREGDRVATFSWNSQHHLEAYVAAPCMGAVCTPSTSGCSPSSSSTSSTTRRTR